jgi:hypothetical protein
MGSGSGRKLTFVPDQPDEQKLGIHGRHATTPLACRRTVRVEIEDHGRSAASMCMRRRSTAQSLHNYYVRGVSWVIWMRIFIWDFCVETRGSLLLLHANRSAA